MYAMWLLLAKSSRVAIHGKDEVDASFPALGVYNPPVSNTEIIVWDLKEVEELYRIFVRHVIDRQLIETLTVLVTSLASTNFKEAPHCNTENILVTVGSGIKKKRALLSLVLPTYSVKCFVILSGNIILC